MSKIASNENHSTESVINKDAQSLKDVMNSIRSILIRVNLKVKPKKFNKDARRRWRDRLELLTEILDKRGGFKSNGLTDYIRNVLKI